MINNICSCFSLISLICSECLFIIRTYALWNNNKFVQDFQLIILAILATRMHLHLWHVDRQIHGCDALMLILLTDVLYVGRTG
ncbi:hypothetical protein DFJ58DRAFT_805837 [Suillus subalutaceus]|uniref:uncharacterized protein n=1 Tax=Suillus subalutaceus TaxID=48586 RepID=UPI001B86BACD|nr:uncharacterized protein DFJ58DRAFT_805837 [Suillus subalutaceus]KAG1842783.1 hypothetical protein DFJ58DRAFT_805837 [Suillus subalutaceus]